MELANAGPGFMAHALTGDDCKRSWMSEHSRVADGTESAGDPGGDVSSLVYLVRHGRTGLNAAGVLRGRLDPPLDEVGQQEAARMGAALRSAHPLLVVASPLRRAVQTAEQIAAQVGAEVETDLRLVDRDYGPWAGMAVGAVEQQWGSVDDAPAVEPVDQVRSRAWEALVDISQRGLGGLAVVVSHDAVLRLLLAVVDPSLGEPGAIDQATGCLDVLRRRGNQWQVLTVNHVPHEGVRDSLPHVQVARGDWE